MPLTLKNLANVLLLKTHNCDTDDAKASKRALMTRRAAIEFEQHHRDVVVDRSARAHLASRDVTPNKQHQRSTVLKAL